MSCPGDAAIFGFLDRTLPAADREALAAHFDACADCRSLLAAAGDDADDDGDASAGATRRYMLLATLGAGAMGIVQSAFDRELDRKVALKFLSTDPGEDAARARARLQREAQALARLSHPNVVTVHDVGVLEGDVFVAMELVEGVTLRAWLAAAPRRVAEVLAVLRQAGEGLAAAHAAGLVHRDFKPDNVLVGDDGRVRVTDFGLARAVEHGPDAAADTRAASAHGTVTRTGVRAGTPAYMAPEQRLGHPPTPRSDVYSYCVTLHEAVTGARPGARTASTRRAPRWLDRAVARGLREQPEDRWPTMRALLDVLARGPRASPARVAIGAGVVALLSLSVAAAARRDARPPLCAPDPAAFDAVWGDARRDAVRAAFLAAYPGRAGAAFRAVDAALGAMRDRWVSMRADTCAATRLRHDQSELLLDLRTACLDARRLRAAAAVEVFARADQAVVENAVAVVADLPRVDECADARALEAVEPVPKDPVRSAAVRDGEAKVAEAWALVESGKEQEALAIAEPALVAARVAAYPPLDARLLLIKGLALMEVGPDTATIEAALRDAAAAAIEARDDAAAAQAWTLLMWQVRGRGNEGRDWGRYVEAALRRLGGDDFLEGDRLATLGVLEQEVGNLDLARALLERARPLVERARGPDYPRLAGIDDALGNVAVGEGRDDEAARLHHQGRLLRERIYGPGHAATISSMFNEEGDLRRLGRAGEAAAILQEIQGTLARRGAPPSGYLELSLADLARDRGDAAGALEHDRRASEGYARELAPDDREQARPLTGQGKDLLLLGRPAQAVGPLERAAKLSSDVSGADRAETLFALARALDAAGRDRSRALSLAQQAAELLDATSRRYPGTPASDLSQVRAWLAARDPSRR